MPSYQSNGLFWVVVLGLSGLWPIGVEGGEGTTGSGGLFIPLSDKDPALLQSGTGGSSPSSAPHWSTPPSRFEGLSKDEVMKGEGAVKGGKVRGGNRFWAPPEGFEDDDNLKPGAFPPPTAQSESVWSRNPPSEDAWGSVHGKPRMADKYDDRFNYSESEPGGEAGSAQSGRADLPGNDGSRWPEEPVYGVDDDYPRAPQGYSRGADDYPDRVRGREGYPMGPDAGGFAGDLWNRAESFMSPSRSRGRRDPYVYPEKGPYPPDPYREQRPSPSSPYGLEIPGNESGYNDLQAPPTGTYDNQWQ